MRWAVEIQKTELDDRNLSDLLDGLGFALIDGSPFPAFTSREMEDCATASDVFEIGKRVREAFKGPANIDPHFELGRVVDYSSDPPKRHLFLEGQSAIVAVSSMKGTLTISPPKGLSEDELKLWEKERAERDYQLRLEGQRQKLEPAYRSTRARKVLELLAAENHRGETLWKIYELMEEHRNNRKAFQKQFGVGDEQFRRFKDAVHNPNVSGDWARHAAADKLNSGNPMSKSEAERFIRDLATKWLAHVRNASRTGKGCASVPQLAKAPWR